MAGYSGTPLAQKLGIKENFKVLAVGTPDNYRSLLEPLPESVQFVSKLDRATSLVHIFSTEKSRLARALTGYRGKLDPAAMVWVSWPKKSAKMAGWSGLKLVVRRKLR